MAKVDGDINHLVEPFRTKAKVFLEVMHIRLPTLSAFETLRSKTRQILLFAQGKSRTLNSKHLKGLACDFVFLKNGKPTRQGNYPLLHRIGNMCGMNHLDWESCHLECDGLDIPTQMDINSNRYIKTTDIGEQQWLNLVNKTFRKYGYKNKSQMDKQ